MILHFITWDVNPELIRFSETFAIRWYGVLFASGFLAGYFIIASFFKKENVPMKLLDTLTTYMVVATVVGARLGHCLLYQPKHYLTNPVEILKIWEGGLASHGAAIAIILALLLFARKSKKPFLWIFDRISIVVALAGAFIRTGNLMNSEIFGYPTDLTWGFKFVRAYDYYPLVPRHPTQIYEALACLLIFAFLMFLYYRKDGKPSHGIIFGYFLTLLFLARFFIEFLKENQVDFEKNMSLNMGQWLSIPFIILGLTSLFFVYRNQKKSIKKEEENV